MVVQAYNPLSCELRQKAFREYQVSLSYRLSSRLAWQFNSVLDHLPSMPKALGSILSAIMELICLLSDQSLQHAEINRGN